MLNDKFRINPSQTIMFPNKLHFEIFSCNYILENNWLCKQI